MSTTGLIALKINKVFPNLHQKISESKLQLNQQVPLEKLKAQTDKELGMTWIKLVSEQNLNSKNIELYHINRLKTNVWPMESISQHDYN